MSAGQGPNQGGLPQQNGNALPPNQMQNLVGGVATGAGGDPQLFMDNNELFRARSFVCDRILSILLQRQTHTIDETAKVKFKEISKRLEEGLYKIATLKEEYLNMNTLEQRLSVLIKSRPGNNHSQRQLVNSSSSIGMMIPTPGMSHSGNSPLLITSSVGTSMIAVSGCNTIPTTVNTGSLLSTVGVQSGSFTRSDGRLSSCNSLKESIALESVNAKARDIRKQTCSHY